MAQLIFPNTNLPSPAENLNPLAEPATRPGDGHPPFQLAEEKPPSRQDNMTPGKEYVVANSKQATPSNHSGEEQPVQNSDLSSNEKSSATQTPLPIVEDDKILPKPAMVLMTATTPVNDSEKTIVTGKEEGRDVGQFPAMIDPATTPQVGEEPPNLPPVKIMTATTPVNDSEKTIVTGKEEGRDVGQFPAMIDPATTPQVGEEPPNLPPVKIMTVTTPVNDSEKTIVTGKEEGRDVGQFPALINPAIVPQSGKEPPHLLPVKNPNTSGQSNGATIITTHPITPLKTATNNTANIPERTTISVPVNTVPSHPAKILPSAAPATSVKVPPGTSSSVSTETPAGVQSESHSTGNKSQNPLTEGSVQAHGIDSKSSGGKLPVKPTENVAVADNLAVPAKGRITQAQDGNKSLSPYRQGPTISQRHLGTGSADSETMDNDKNSRPVPQRIFGAEKAANAVISMGKPFSQSNKLSLSELYAGKSNFARIGNTTLDDGMSKIFQAAHTADVTENRTSVQPVFRTGEGNPAANSIPEFMQKLMKQIDQMQQSGRTLLKLSLELPRGETLDLKVDFRQDQVFVRFIINVPEIRRALEKAWGRLTEMASQRGLNLAPPSFDIRRRSRSSLSGTDREGVIDSTADNLTTLGDNEPGMEYAAQWSPSEKAGAERVHTGSMT